MKYLKFSIIIANYNGEKYLLDCLSSVFKTTYPKFEVIIVEDGSADKSLEIILSFKRKHNFLLIQNRKNLGLVANRNKASKKAKGDVLVFLDNDTRVDKKWLDGLNRVFSTDNTIGAAQCKIFDFHKNHLIQEVGMKLIPYTGFGTTIGRGQKDHGQFDYPLEVIALGAALVVKKEVVKKIGGFDNKLFHYTDDLDFSWRVWIAGFKVVLSPQSIVYHYTKIHQPNYKLYFHLTKNSIRMIVKNYQLSNVVKFFPVCLAFNLAGALYVLLSRGSFIGIFGFILGIVWNLFTLPDLLHERAQVQKYRRVADKVIFDKIMLTTNIFDIYKRYFKVAKTTVSLMKNR